MIMWMSDSTTVSDSCSRRQDRQAGSYNNLNLLKPASAKNAYELRTRGRRLQSAKADAEAGATQEEASHGGGAGNRRAPEKTYAQRTTLDVTLY
jgi:hypothetical protein